MGSGAKNGRVYLSFPSEQAFLLAKIKDGQMCGTDRINIHSWKQDERNKYNARQKREQRSARSTDGGRGGPRQAGGQGNGGRRSGRGGDPYQGTGGRGGRNNWRKDGHRKGRGDDKHSRRRKKEEEVVEEQPNFAKNTYALLDIDDDNSD